MNEACEQLNIVIARWHLIFCVSFKLTPTSDLPNPLGQISIKQQASFAFKSFTNVL